MVKSSQTSVQGREQCTACSEVCQTKDWEIETLKMSGSKRASLGSDGVLEGRDSCSSCPWPCSCSDTVCNDAAAAACNMLCTTETQERELPESREAGREEMGTQDILGHLLQLLVASQDVNNVAWYILHPSPRVQWKLFERSGQGLAAAALSTPPTELLLPAISSQLMTSHTRSLAQLAFHHHFGVAGPRGRGLHGANLALGES